MKKNTCWSIILFFQFFLTVETFAVSASECYEADYECWNGYDESTGTSSQTNDCKKWMQIKQQCMSMGSDLKQLPTITMQAYAERVSSLDLDRILQRNVFAESLLGNNGSQFFPELNHDTNNKTCNPIQISSGYKYQEELDFSSTGEMPLEFVRFYNSSEGIGVTNRVGLKWRHNFDYRIVGYEIYKYYRVLPDGTFTRNGELVTLSDQSMGKWLVKLLDGGTEYYDNKGRLVNKKNSAGIGWQLSYDGENLTKVVHTNGKMIKLIWQNGKLTQVIDPAGNIYSYTYNGDLLASVTYPDGIGSRTYHYGENGANAQVLSGITINGKRYNTYYFNGNKAYQSGRSDGTQVDKLVFGDIYTIVKNPLGAVSKYIYTNNQKNKLARVERSGVNNYPNSNMENNYDLNGRISSKKDWNGIV
ncbi:MAG: hypothetical protein GAK29_01156 [Acinetobacter bereziniae]|uniref:DUF6531 domain-containing protein n=1 Tax=Acinetobacter bereziniae TaxID=106648 RepID=A0A833UWW1_ACIBZ|nr:MAG: hypothetical protein GAK29_01156 [Acinetobacter bereziniae]